MVDIHILFNGDKLIDVMKLLLNIIFFYIFCKTLIRLYEIFNINKTLKKEKELAKDNKLVAKSEVENSLKKKSKKKGSAYKDIPIVEDNKKKKFGFFGEWF